MEIIAPEFQQENRIITILGPTACGKTRRAVELARHFGGEIISADSRQVYRGMDIGTGKDLEEYQEIPYHIIDICEAGEKYNLHKFITDFRKSLLDLNNRNKSVIFCGGTGLYLETALSGIDLPEVPENKELRSKLQNLSLQELTDILSKYKKLHNITDIDTPKRAIRAIEIETFYAEHPEQALKTDKKSAKPLHSLIIGVDISRDERRRRISKRLQERLEHGMLQEVQVLLDSGVSAEDLIYYGLEYKFLTLHLIGKLNFEEMVKNLEIAIHQFAKRQMTWFRGMEKRGYKIHWLPYDLSSSEFIQRVEEKLAAPLI